MKNILQIFAFIFGFQNISEPNIKYHYHNYDNKRVFVDGIEIRKSNPEKFNKTEFIKYMFIKKNIICL